MNILIFRNTINQIGVRLSVICSDGYVCVERCLGKWLRDIQMSPVKRHLTDYARKTGESFNFKGVEIKED